MLPAPPPIPSASVTALVHRLAGMDLTQCPACHAGRLRREAIFRPGARPVPVEDSS